MSTEQNSESPVEPQRAEAFENTDTGVMDLLHEHVPLSLLMDLSSPSGPNSEAILDEEGAPEDEWWEQP